jgi:nicotinamide-nucleotide amidase
MRAEIITIGDELCRGEIVDTNANWLAAALWDLQITVTHIVSCRDLIEDMAAALQSAAARSDLVLVSGGLGPTLDDLTVDVLCELAHQPAVTDPASEERMRARFATASVSLGDNALRQVRVPQNARVYSNPVGLAPAFEILLDGAVTICMPGPPRELKAIFDTHLRSRIAEARHTLEGEAEHIARVIFRVFGKGEGHIATLLEGLIVGARDSLHFQVSFPETLVKLVSRAADPERAQANLAALAEQVRSRLGSWIYGENDDSLAAALGRALVAKGQSIAVAESCTGGMICSLLTDLSGSSAYFSGGAVTYSNAEKVRQLGVSEATLQEHGAVSEAVVLEMVRGVRERVGADWGVSVSGIAGPTGGTEEKPVGTVWLAVEGPEGQSFSKKYMWPGSRDQVRVLAAHWALNAVRNQLQEGKS